MTRQWTDTRRKTRYTFWQVYLAFVRVAFTYAGHPSRWLAYDYRYLRTLWALLWRGRIDLALWETATVKVLRER